MENALLERILRTYRDDLADKVRKFGDTVGDALGTIADEIEEFDFSDEPTKKTTEPSGNAQEWNLRTWQEAIDHGRTVSFKYDKPGSTFSEFKTLILPKAIDEEHQLLLGEDKGQPRAYRIDRIVGYVIAGQ